MIRHNHTIILFLLAASSLLFVGNIFSNGLNWQQIVLQQWCGLAGTYFIYHLGGFVFDIKSGTELRQNMALKKGIAFFVLHVVFVLPVLVFLYLSSFSFWVFVSIFALGCLYSMPISLRGRTVVLKKVVVAKNLLIAYSWAALVLVGGATWHTDYLVEIFLFVFTQIFTGSILRDFYDLEKDKLMGIQTIPLLWGTKRTIRVSHFINVSVFVLGVVALLDTFLLVVFALSTLYKAALIQQVHHNPRSVYFTQTLNIGLCVFLFLLFLIHDCYARFF